MVKRGCLLVVLFFVGAFIMAWIQVPDAEVTDGDVVEVLTGGFIADGVKFDVISDEAFNTAKRSVDIRLSEPITEADLKELAYRILDSTVEEYDRTFIGYYLPGMPVNEGYWATSHCNPNLEIRIIGE